ncbi:MAG: GGDEF domain-containing protein, partial [Gallionella sp.]|nr:GGDEF domain-containing protein [Gallionella sp.]
MAQRKLVPTPDNYAKIFAEISGTPSMTNNGAEQVLQDIAEYLQKTEETAASGNALKTIINQADWAQCGTELENILSSIPDDSKAAQPWAV